MFGVVVWSSPERLKAVIWCDDHAALAYLSGSADFNGSRWPEAGDLLELETVMDGAIRRALNVRLQSSNWCPALPEQLRHPHNGPVRRAQLRLVASHGRPAPAPEPGQAPARFSAAS